MDDITGAGAGIGGGIVGAVLTLLGFKSRLDSQDKAIDEIRKTVQWKDTCIATHKPMDETLKRVELKLDRLLVRRREDREENQHD
jgi:hypothetical protein